MRLPLLVHRDRRAPLAYRAAGTISVDDFLADVAHLAAVLPPATHMLNICSDRYRFAVGLAAAMVAGKISLLPSTHTPEAVRQLREFAPDVFCLTDFDTDIALPTLYFPQHFHRENSASSIPTFPSEQLVAYVFTSGSTGTPVAHAKTWGALIASVRSEARRLDIMERGYTLVGTVPAQHMYGFESTVLLALQSGAAFWAGKPFFAADIASALNAVPPPRMLVSTPFHLRAVIDSDIALPAIACVLSATAPLTQELACAIENFCSAPLFEIYGCTESGQIASRCPAREQIWQLLDGVSMVQRNETTYVHVAGIDADIALGDIIETTADGRFMLHGRSGDLINIAGKRTALGFLNQQLLTIPGVRDGVFFLPNTDSNDGITRLAAFVVAPELNIADIMRALRARIDPLFLPRPLYRVEQLPRNAAGKLSHRDLQSLLTQLRAQQREKQ
jgi:acyl-coenzyme A synthetase/AMP-(fatty) acid ligase